MTPSLHWIQRQRDEAHRLCYYVSSKFKKKRRYTGFTVAKKRYRESLQLKNYLDYFGTFEAINSAKEEDIVESYK